MTVQQAQRHHPADGGNGDEKARDAAVTADIIAKIRAIEPEIRKLVPECERLTYLSPAMVALVHSTGAYSVDIPVVLGGAGLSAKGQAAIFSTLAEIDGSVAWSVAIGATLPTAIGLAFNEKAIAEIFSSDWVGPLFAGSTFSTHAQGKARRVEGGWMVKGKWGFCSNVRMSEWLVGGVDCDDGTGRGTCLMARDQFADHIADDWHVMGLAATSTNTVKIEEEVFVPEHRLIPLGELLPRCIEYLARVDSLTPDRVSSITVYLSSMALGLAKGCFGAFLEQTKSRKPLYLPYENMAKTPSVQVAAAKAHAKIAAADALIQSLCERVDRIPTGEVFEMSEIQTFASYSATLCCEAVDLMQHTLGSSTASLKNPIQRYLRDIKVLSTHGTLRMDFVSECHGRLLMGEPPFPPIL